MAVLSCLVAAAFNLTASPSLAAQSASRPNIIFIFADDLGYADLSCYGHPYARTPNLDRLAREGTRFQQFYVTGVTCCPSRTGLMTSRHPASYPTYPAVGGFGDRVTVTELLKKAGYHTGHFGKWHIGPAEAPGTYGIDAIGTAEEDSKRGKKDGARGRDAPIYDQAIAFVEKHKDEPFYMNVWSHVSHHPVNPPEKFVAMFNDLKVKEADFSDYMHEKFQACRELGGDVDDAMRRYLADVFTLDQDIGRLLAKVDELGLREKTLVVFSSDHGPGGLKLGEPGKKKEKPGGAERENLRLNQMGYAGPLRGGKHGAYEGGVRVPFILRWPGQVPAGRVDDTSVLSGMDWLPTICRLAGVTINAADFEGEDVAQTWLSGVAHGRSKPLFWKTSAPNSDPSMRDGDWKFHGSHRRRGEVQLYNVAKDPEERRNLADENPQMVKELSARLAAWVATLPKEYVKGEEKDD
jgi:N-acetylgalactosamine-6-sulfatase